MAVFTPSEAQLAVIAVLAAARCGASGSTSCSPAIASALLAVLGAAVIALVVLGALAFHGAAAADARARRRSASWRRSRPSRWRGVRRAAAWKPPVVARARRRARRRRARHRRTDRRAHASSRTRRAWAASRSAHGAARLRPALDARSRASSCADAIATLAGTVRRAGASPERADDRSGAPAAHRSHVARGIARRRCAARTVRHRVRDRAGADDRGRPDARPVTAPTPWSRARRHRRPPSRSTGRGGPSAALGGVHAEPPTAIVLDGHGTPSQEATEPLAAVRLAPGRPVRSISRAQRTRRRWP